MKIGSKNLQESKDNEYDDSYALELAKKIDKRYKHLFNNLKNDKKFLFPKLMQD